VCNCICEAGGLGLPPAPRWRPRFPTPP
jgi:hypothetical protein